MNEIDDDVYRVIDDNFNEKDDLDRRSQSAFNVRQNNYSEIKATFKYQTNTIIKKQTNELEDDEESNSMPEPLTCKESQFKEYLNIMFN